MSVAPVNGPPVNGPPVNGATVKDGRLEVWLFIVQRLTAMILGPLVIVHLATMIYAIQGGLSAAEIMGRTQGSLTWGLVYGAFVAAAALHGAIGLRQIAREALQWRGCTVNAAALVFCLGVLWLGYQAVGALV